MFYVYVLQSTTNHRKYIGQTNNLKRRLAEHNSGKSVYTRLTKPYTMVYSVTFPTRTEAIKRETELKSGKGREWLKALLG